MDAPQPEQNIEWFHDGYRVIRVFVQDPMDMATRERVLAAVTRFREIQGLAALKAEVAAIASATGLRSTVIHEADGDCLSPQPGDAYSGHREGNHEDQNERTDAGSPRFR